MLVMILLDLNPMILLLIVLVLFSLFQLTPLNIDTICKEGKSKTVSTTQRSKFFFLFQFSFETLKRTWMNGSGDTFHYLSLLISVPCWIAQRMKTFSLHNYVICHPTVFYAIFLFCWFL